eukprot:20263_1
MDYFAKTSNNVHLSEDKRTIKHVKYARGLSNNYGSIVMPSTEKKIHRWKFRINHQYLLDITFGIDSAPGIMDDTLAVGGDEPFYWRQDRENYGWRIDTNTFTMSKENINGPYGNKCYKNDIIEMILDLSNATLSFRINNQDEAVCFKNIKQKSDLSYLMVVSAFSARSSVTLLSESDSINNNITMDNIEPQKKQTQPTVNYPSNDTSKEEKEEILKLKDEIKTLKDKLKNATIEELKTDNEKQTKEITELKAQSTEKEEALLKLNNKEKEFKEQNESQEKTISDLTQQLKTLEQNKTNYNAKMEESKKEIKTLKQKQKKDIGKLNKDIEKLNQEKIKKEDGYNKTIKEKADAIAKLEEQLSQQKMDNDNNKNHSLIEKLKSDHATEIKALNDENKDKTEQITKLEEELSKMLPKVAAIATTTGDDQINQSKTEVGDITDKPIIQDILKTAAYDKMASDEKEDLTTMQITLTDHKIIERLKDCVKDLMVVDAQGNTTNLCKIDSNGKNNQDGLDYTLTFDGDYDKYCADEEAIELFKKNAIDRLAKVLSIDSSLIKITGLKKGSIIVDFTIEEKGVNEIFEIMVVPELEENEEEKEEKKEYISTEFGLTRSASKSSIPPT